MALAHNPRISLNGLVLCLDAANPKSYPGTGTVWKDLSGNGNDATLVNGVGFDSDNKGSMVFDGVDDLAISGLEQFNFENTISGFVWVYNNGLRSYRGVLSNGYSTAGSFELRFGREDFFGGNNNGTRLGSAIRSSSNQVSSSINIFADIDSWGYYGFTYDGETHKVYKNGDIFNFQSYTGGMRIGSTGFPVVIGTAQNSVTPTYREYFQGEIPRVEIYNRALTPEEIQQNFQATRGRYGI